MRLFINDGHANFQLATSAFPTNGANIAVAIAHDFDHDGDQDLFVGGRSVPRDYGLDPRSYLFENDGSGHFKDVTQTKAPAVAAIGMVTDAKWADISGDKQDELIIVGEWMAPRIFAYANGRFSETTTNLNEMMGWWQSVTVADMNNDGKNDLVLGNIGENFYLRPGSKTPVKLWMADVDGNGDVDKILSYTVDGNDKPVFLRNDLQEQIPGIKKENLKNNEYAKKTVQQLFNSEILKKAQIKKFSYPSSCIAFNTGQGNFRISTLPARAQLSSVNAVLCFDVNHDGFTDIVSGGNKAGFLPQMEKLDASHGDVFLNDKKGGFRWVPPLQTGLQIRGEVRDLKKITTARGDYLLFLRNNTFPMMYKVNQ